MDMSYNNPNSDLNKKAERFLNETILNVILKELPEEYKDEFCSLIEQDRFEEQKILH